MVGTRQHERFRETCEMQFRESVEKLDAMMRVYPAKPPDSG